jgi:hypothetical protein
VDVCETYLMVMVCTSKFNSEVNFTKVLGLFRSDLKNPSFEFKLQIGIFQFSICSIHLKLDYLGI